MRRKRQMDKLRFLTESRNGKKSVIEKLIHKDNSSSNRISCSIAEKSDIKSVMDICFARQQWMTEQGFNYVLNKDNRKYYRHKIEDRKLWVCKQSGVVMGFCVVEDHDINGYWKDFPTDSFVYAHDGMTRPHKSVKETSDYNFIGILLNAIIDFYGKGIRFDVLLPNQRLESFYEKELGCNPVKKVIDEDDGSWHLLMEKTNNNPSLTESFTKKISSKKNTDLISEPSFVLDNGVYIFHKTLGVKTVEGWNKKFNKGVVGVLLVEDDHKIVIAMEDSSNELLWSKERKLVNQLIRNEKDAKSDFNGEKYCRNLNSPDFPAAYYCLNYNKGGRDWYLPSTGELWLIYQHLEEIQNALSIVEGQRFVTTWDFTTWDGGLSYFYWSSTENSPSGAWRLHLGNGNLYYWNSKVSDSGKVRPISKFQPSELKESFTHKIRKTSNKDLVDIADKLATTNFDYNEENFKNKLRKETELYYKSDFYKTFHYPLDYRHNGDCWAADEDGFHDMYLESTYWAERNETVDFEGYSNDVDANYAESADVGVFVLGYGKDCVAYSEYNEYKKTHPLTESFTTKTKNKTVKDLQNKSDNVFNLDNLLREYVKSHCRPGSHNYDFYFSEENRPVFSDKEWKKLKGITVVKEIDDYYPSLHVVTPKGFTISDDFIPNTDDVFLFYVYKRRTLHIPVNRLPDKLSQELKEWVLNVNESFVRKSSSKSSSDMVSDTEDFDIELLIKDFILRHTRSFNRRSLSWKYFSHGLYIDETHYRKEFFPFLGFIPYFGIVSDNYHKNQDKPIGTIVDDKGNKIPYKISTGEVLVACYVDSDNFGWVPLRILPKEYKKKIYQRMKVLGKNLLESFTRKTKQKSAEDIKQKADESVLNLENLVKEIVLENDSFTKDTILTRTLGRRRPYCTHVLKNLRVKPTKDPTLSPYAIQGMVVLDESFYFKPEKYDISPLLAETLKKKSMKELYNSDSIIVLNRIYTMEYRGKELLRTEFNILRYNERYGRYSDVMNPQDVCFEFTDLPKKLQWDIYSFLRKKFNKK